MEQNNKWSKAAMDGLYLSLVTIIYSLIMAAFQPENFAITSLLWTAKFAGCIFLLWYFMNNWSKNFETITFSQSYNYGFLICLFSSILCACYSYLLHRTCSDKLKNVIKGSTFNHYKVTSLDSFYCDFKRFACTKCITAFGKRGL